MSSNADQNNSLIEDFIQDALNLMDEAIECIQPSGCPLESVNKIFRCLHTLKGSSGFLELTALSSFIHRFEDFVRDKQNAKEGLTPKEGEKVLKGFKLLQRAILRARNSEEMDSPEYRQFLQSLEKLRTEKASFSRLHDLARQIGDTLGPKREQEEASILLPAIEALESVLKNLQSQAKGAILPIDYRAIVKVELKGSDVTELVKAQLEALEKVAIEGKAAFGSLDVKALTEGLFSIKALLGKNNFILDWDVVEDLCGISAEVVEEAFKRIWHEGVVAQGEVELAEKLPATMVESAGEKSTAAKPSNTEETGEVEEYFRIPSVSIEEISHVVGSLVANRNALENLIQELGQHLPSRHRRYFSDSYAELDRLVNMLERKISGLNNRKLQDIFKRLPAMKNQLCRDLDKEVELEITGGEIEIPRSLIKNLNDPLIHLVRNSLDHGIERKKERAAVGKAEKGTLRILAERHDDVLILVVSDDGKGLDRDKILKKAREKGLVDPERHLMDEEIYNLLFMPGFSTSTTITAVSGRGVGLDVVRTAILEKNGSIAIESSEGKGAAFKIFLPLAEGKKTRDVLLIEIDGQVYGIDYRCLVEVLHRREISIHAHRGRHFFNYRDNSLPYMDLSSYLNGLNARGKDHDGSPDREIKRVLVIEDEQSRRFACGVSEIRHKVKVVVTPFEHSFLRENPLFLGTAVVGTGDPCLILDLRDASPIMGNGE